MKYTRGNWICVMRLTCSALNLKSTFRCSFIVNKKGQPWNKCLDTQKYKHLRRLWRYSLQCHTYFKEFVISVCLVVYSKYYITLQNMAFFYNCSSIKKKALYINAFTKVNIVSVHKTVLCTVIISPWSTGIRCSYSNIISICLMHNINKGIPLIAILFCLKSQGNEMLYFNSQGYLFQ